MSDQLTKENWVEHGLAVLRDKGHESLKADPLARALGVSRGSFYWHFPSLADFHAAVLQAWRVQITESVIAELGALPHGQDPLTALITKTLETPQTLEVAVRRWGGVDPAAAQAIAAVDRLRADYLAGLFRASGMDEAEAVTRAALLTWAFVGRAFAPQFADDLPANAAADLAGLALGKGGLA